MTMFGQRAVGAGWGPPPANTEMMRYNKEMGQKGLESIAAMIGGMIGGGVRGSKNAKTIKAGGTVASGEPTSAGNGILEGMLLTSPGGEDYKRDKDLGKAAQYFMNAMGEDGYKALNMPKEKWDTLGSRDKAAAVAQLFRAQTLRDMQQPQQQRQDMAGAAGLIRERLAARAGGGESGYDPSSEMGKMFEASGSKGNGEPAKLSAEDIMAALEKHPGAARDMDTIVNGILREQDTKEMTPYQKAHLDYLGRDLEYRNRTLDAKVNPAAAPPTAQPVITAAGERLGHMVGERFVREKAAPKLTQMQQNLLSVKALQIRNKQAELDRVQAQIAEEPDNERPGPDWMKLGTSYKAQETQLMRELAMLDKDVERIRTDGQKEEEAQTTKEQPGQGPAKPEWSPRRSDFEQWKKNRNKKK